jgi:hypothetical protein
VVLISGGAGWQDGIVAGCWRAGGGVGGRRVVVAAATQA